MRSFGTWNPYNGYINPYYWVDDHPLLYGTIGSLDPSTFNGEVAPPNMTGIGCQAERRAGTPGQRLEV